ncbi:MAG: hypothetical protein E7311_00280 [Clostridiales bacterium]|nr:hypothetical protein [Clostridiales bacterium]
MYIKEQIVTILNSFKFCPNYICEKGEKCPFVKEDLILETDTRIFEVEDFLAFHHLTPDDFRFLLFSYRSLKKCIGKEFYLSDKDLFKSIKYFYDLFDLDNTILKTLISNVCPKGLF